MNIYLYIYIYVYVYLYAYLYLTDTDGRRGGERYRVGSRTVLRATASASARQGRDRVWGSRAAS